jgi:N,N'-diacetyllegionaminate synthase
MNKKTYIIAEIGINHNGSLKNALRLIKKAKQCGADAVKFQLYQTITMANKKDKKKYKLFKKRKKETLYNMWERLRIKKNWLKKIENNCKKNKIELGFSIFDSESLKMLSHIKYKFIKIASSDITDLNLIKKFKKTKKWIIASSGMANKKEMNEACNIIGKNKFSLLHCVSAYPTPIKNINLKRMLNLKKLCKSVGFSDHTIGITSSIVAINLGAKIIEKHFTDNKLNDGPDHLCSADTKDLKYICNYNLDRIKTLGTGKINPSANELKMKKFARKSLFAKKKIAKNEFFTCKNVAARRPGIGLAANKIFKILGTKSKYHFNINDLIKI